MQVHEPLRAIEYPSSDGKPMGETDVHIQLIADVRFTLRNFFRATPDIYVATNLLLYYIEGNPRRFVVPDVFVARGVGNHQRRVYKIWEESRAPEMVIEFSSRQTWREDVEEKWQLYEHLGIREYFIFDPDYDYLTTPLIGYRLDAELCYAPLEIENNRLHSETLGLDLVDTGNGLRFFDSRTNQFLLTPEEEAEAHRREVEAHRRETEMRQQAEAEAARLRAELARLRGEGS